MPKVSVYLSDDLYRRARDGGLPISLLAQQAIETALHGSSTDRWIQRVRGRSRRGAPGVDTAELLDRVRAEFGA